MTKKSINYIVYRFGVLGQPSPTDKVTEILRLRRKLWNALVAIERTHRTNVLSIGKDSQAHADYEVAKERLRSLRETLNQVRAKDRKRTKHPELQAEIVVAREHCKACAAAEKESRKQARSNAKDRMEELESIRSEEAKKAYSTSGLWWGNYNDIVAQYNAARASAIKTGTELKFRDRFESGGQISILDTVKQQTTIAAIGGSHRKITLTQLPGKNLYRLNLRAGTTA